MNTRSIALLGALYLAFVGTIALDVLATMHLFGVPTMPPLFWVVVFAAYTTYCLLWLALFLWAGGELWHDHLKLYRSCLSMYLFTSIITSYFAIAHYIPIVGKTIPIADSLVLFVVFSMILVTISGYYLHYFLSEGNHKRQ